MIFIYLLLIIPVSWTLWYFDAPSWTIFVASALAIVPLAEWIRRATEQIAKSAGSVIGGLMNISFGNLAELILAIFILFSGKPNVVKASITGSIVGNCLLCLGLSILVGSWGREKQTFKRARAGLLSSLLILSLIALLIPAIFNYTERGLANASDRGMLNEYLSLGTSIVLVLIYAANLVYTLITHKDVFAGAKKEKRPLVVEWPWWKSTLVLVTATAAVAIQADLISGQLEKTAESLGLTLFFVGIVILPIIGNAAEYFSAIYFARQNQMGLVMSIAVGSSIQVALLTAPLLVLLSYLFGHPMTLVFNNPLELIAIAGAAFAVNSISRDGEITWFGGALLLAVYLLLAMAFFWVTL